MAWSTLPDGTAKVNVRPFIARMEGELRGGANEASRARVLATLQRWQWDDMLDEPSRAHARRLAMEFGHLEAVLAPLVRRPTGTLR
jgi:hypothetical protein